MVRPGTLECNLCVWKLKSDLTLETAVLGKKGPTFFFACGALIGTVAHPPESATLAATITPVAPEVGVAAPG